MAWFDFLKGSAKPGLADRDLWVSDNKPAPRAAGDSGSVFQDINDPRVAEYLRGGAYTESGAIVTPEGSLRVAVAYRCMGLLQGAVKSMPLDFKRRVGNKRVDADNDPMWSILQVKPNGWQTPSEFKSFMQMSVLTRGNGYALKVKGVRGVQQLLPLMPGRVVVTQNSDLSLSYLYTAANGSQATFDQTDIFHLRGMSLDGVRGLSPIAYAAEQLGLSIQAEKFVSKLFANGAVPGGVLSHPKQIDNKEVDRLKESIAEFRGADNAQKLLLLEDGMKYERIAMTTADAQLLQLLEMSEYDIAMRFGVPPYMLGLTSKTTSWGSGIEQMGQAFVAYTLQDYLTMWEEAIRRDLLVDGDPKIYVRFNPAGLIRGDIKTRYAAYAIGRMWGWLSANDVRALEDLNPIDGDGGDIYLSPSNMISADKVKDMLPPGQGQANNAAAQAMLDATNNLIALMGHNGGPALDSDTGEGGE